MIRIEVKKDKTEKWIRLSVWFHDACPMEEVKMCAVHHMEQYCIEHNQNHYQYATRILDNSGKVLFIRISDAEANTP